VGVTVAGSIVVVSAAGLGVGISYAVVSGDRWQVARMVGAALASLPAVLTLVGIALALFGWAPRACTAVWGAFAAVVAVLVFGEVLGLPSALRTLSPFEHLAAAPAEAVDLRSTLVLSGISVALTAAGFVGFRRRDLA
jgi:ABC-2 type transport system permease protein